MERKYGFVPSPKDLRDYKLNNVYMSVKLPTEFEVAHSEIKDQGKVNSCVAHSIAEILEANELNRTKYSTGWIYGYRPNGYYQGEGMITAEALKTVNKVGYIKYEDLDVNIEMKEAKDIVDKNMSIYRDRASRRKIASYARLRDISEIKQALYISNKPVLLAIMVGTNGIELDKNNIAYIPKEYAGGHQMVCYGWNKFGLLIQNSWGEDFGNKGTFVLPYEYPIAESWLIKFQGEVTDASSIVKPKFYFLRRLSMKLYKAVKKITKK